MRQMLQIALNNLRSNSAHRRAPFISYYLLNAIIFPFFLVEIFKKEWKRHFITWKYNYNSIYIIISDPTVPVGEMQCFTATVEISGRNLSNSPSYSQKIHLFDAVHYRLYREIVHNNFVSNFDILKIYVISRFIPNLVAIGWIFVEIQAFEFFPANSALSLCRSTVRFEYLCLPTVFGRRTPGFFP